MVYTARKNSDVASSTVRAHISRSLQTVCWGLMINMADRSITWRLGHRAIPYRLSCHTILGQSVWATDGSVRPTSIVR